MSHSNMSTLSAHTSEKFEWTKCISNSRRRNHHCYFINQFVNTGYSYPTNQPINHSALRKILIVRLTRDIDKKKRDSLLLLTWYSKELFIVYDTVDFNEVVCRYFNQIGNFKCSSISNWRICPNKFDLVQQKNRNE